jgi:hypothetical protein
MGTRKSAYKFLKAEATDHDVRISDSIWHRTQHKPKHEARGKPSEMLNVRLDFVDVQFVGEQIEL